MFGKNKSNKKNSKNFGFNQLLLTFSSVVQPCCHLPHVATRDFNVATDNRLRNWFQIENLMHITIMVNLATERLWLDTTDLEASSIYYSFLCFFPNALFISTSVQHTELYKINRERQRFLGNKAENQQRFVTFTAPSSGQIWQIY